MDATTAGTQRWGRLMTASGAAFVAAILVGNGLTEDGTEPQGDAELLADLARRATEAGPRTGLALELVGFALFVVFLGRLGALTARSPGDGFGRVAVLAGAVMLGVKLATGSAALAAVAARDEVSAAVARGLLTVGDVGFVLSMLPFAVFTAATALALQAAGLVGRPTATVGAVLGVLTLGSAVAGATDVEGAFVLPFVLSLFWLAVVSVRRTVRCEPRTALATEPRPALV